MNIGQGAEKLKGRVSLAFDAAFVETGNYLMAAVCFDGRDEDAIAVYSIIIFVKHVSRGLCDPQAEILSVRIGAENQFVCLYQCAVLLMVSEPVFRQGFKDHRCGQRL